MTPDEPTSVYAAVVRDAIQRAGGLRPLSRLLHRHGERVSPSQLSNLRDGFSPYDIRVTKAMAAVYPDLAIRLYEAMGLEPPSSLLPPTPPDTPSATAFAADVARIARARGIPEADVLPTLVAEELRRLEEKENQ